MSGRYPESGWYTETGSYPETVVLDLTAMLVADDGAGIPVHAVFRYDVSDPYAVRAAFSSPASPMVTWIFARELLTHGVLDVAGQGDVQVWRAAGEPHDVCIGLNSPDGHAILQVSGAALSTFLRKTFALCWPGEEDVHLDTDQAIEPLLAS